MSAVNADPPSGPAPDFELQPDPGLWLDDTGRIELANRAARDRLRTTPGATVHTLVGALGLSAVQWVLAQLRQAARLVPADTPQAWRLGPRVMGPGGQAWRLALAQQPGRRWWLRLSPAQAAAGAPAAAPAEPEPLRELRRMFWDSPFPVILQDAQLRVIDVNQALLDFTGFARDYLIGLDPIVLLHPEDREAQLETRQQLSLALDEGGEASAFTQRRFIDARGQTRWYRAVTHVIRSTAPGAPWCFSVLQDCTSEILAREMAERSAAELDHWFDLSPVGMMLFDEDGLVVRSNPALAQLVGELPASLADVHHSLRDLLGWYTGGPLAGLHPGSPPLLRHGWVEHPDGDERSLRAVVRCLETHQGRRRFMSVVEDRTAEDELDRAQSQLGVLVETAHAGLALFDDQRGRFHPAGAAAAGQALPSSQLKAISRELVRSDSLAEFDRVQRALRSGERAEARYAIVHPELGLRWLLTRVEPRVLGSGKRSTSVITLDVTEQHQTQQRNDRLLRELTTILDSTSAGIAYLRGQTLLRYNRQFERLLGLEGSTLLEPRLSELLRDAGQDQDLAYEALNTLASAGQYEAEIEIRLPGRELRWCALSMRRMDSPGPEIESIAVLSDITRLKTQQMELQAVVRDRELMFSLSDVGIVFLRQGRVQRANEGFSLLSGYPLEELEQRFESELFDPQWDPDGREHAEARALAEVGHWAGERVLCRKDGRLQWVQVSKRLVEPGRPEGGVIASYVNVDARHRAEQALVTQAERTRAILDSVFVGIVTVGPHGIEWMNRSARRMFGGELADFAGQPMSVVASDDPSHPFRDRALLNRLDEGQVHTFECEVAARDGRRFWVVGNAVVTGAHALGGRELTFALLDIDSRRQAERRIAQARASLQRIIELAPLAITLRDARTLKILQINQTAADIAGRPIDQLVGTTPEDIYDPQEAAQFRADMQEALRSEGVTHKEYRVRVKGQPTVWDARFMPLAQPGEPADQLLLVATNVTEQRAAEEARLEAAIAQRELLVKEVHHRIKNNLQGVAGLLQQIAQRKPEMAGPISEVAGQVQAIAHVYGLQVGASGPLRLRKVVQAITGSVQRTFDRTIVMLEQGEGTGEWVLPEAESIPIALSLNELLTNAVKHSPGGEVSCVLDSEADAVSISVRNRGRLPEDFSLDQVPAGVSGLGLIRALLPRRSARLSLQPDGDDGVCATVRLVPPGATRQPT
ncbi:MAG: PAS domain S-box protein [Caldimonas sp.]|uniref:PAS domain-containing sensor histidine kinase n=1 Tax=Caldimonas sp. TaxID=2838790 RepID=UPI00391C230E